MSALSFQYFLLPTLSALDCEVEVSNSGTLARIVAEIDLSIKHTANADSSETRKAFAKGLGEFEIVRPVLELTFGGRIALANTVGTALTHLRCAGLVERCGRGVYRVTPEGYRLLSTKPTRIDLNLLRKIPRYADWFGYRKGKSARKEVVAGMREGPSDTSTEEANSIYWTEAVRELWPVDSSPQSLQFSIEYDLELGMLPEFAEALREHAKCGTCRQPPQVYFDACNCGDDSMIYVVERKIWKKTLEPLWKRDRRRAYKRNSREWRQQMIRDSDEPSYSPADIELLRSIQNDMCYYCGTSISEGFDVDHLEPLVQGGSNGVGNIMLACSKCNQSKWAHSEAKYWRRLRKRFSESEFNRLRESAKIMKREKRKRLRERE